MRAAYRHRSFAAAILCASWFGARGGLAAGENAPDEQRFRELYRELVEINTTDSAGDTVRAAEAMARRLRAGRVGGQVPAVEVYPLRKPRQPAGYLSLPIELDRPIVGRRVDGRIAQLPSLAPMLAFSADTRRSDLERMADRHLDVLVIGGGITGCGITLDAASGGSLSASSRRTTSRRGRPVAPRA